MRSVGSDSRFIPTRATFEGVLFGTAVGDALGLPAENLSPRRIRTLWGGEWRMRFLFGHGMISDDTEHTLIVAQALLTEADDPEKFQCGLARGLKWWFAALPGGVGLATAKSCLRMWIGLPLTKCAVVSAGGGPAMRSAIIGAYFADDAERRRAFTLASSRLTHRSWQAETVALAVAETTAFAVSDLKNAAFQQLTATLRQLSSEGEWQGWIDRIESGLAAQTTVSKFASEAGLAKGVSGYAMHVVPVALYSYLRHPGDFKSALTEALNCGGDTDTVGAIVAGISGARLGVEAIPENWSSRICEWPRSKKFMQDVAARLATQKSEGKHPAPAGWIWPAILPRNIFFLIIVLLHGLRRLLPPY
jgi:ADP-ribosyl-[dinitrogen reductase] hydrolase